MLERASTRDHIRTYIHKLPERNQSEVTRFIIIMVSSMIAFVVIRPFLVGQNGMQGTNSNVE